MQRSERGQEAPVRLEAQAVELPDCVQHPGAGPPPRLADYMPLADATRLREDMEEARGHTASPRVPSRGSEEVGRSARWKHTG